MKWLRFLRDLCVPPRFPPYLIYFVTARCNLKCRHCFYWNELNGHRNELTLEEIGRIAESLPHLFFLRVTGGEPFLRKDLHKILRLFHEKSSLNQVGINTNGTLTESTLATVEQTLVKLDRLRVEIGISIDHLGERHDALRGCSGAFDQAMHTYDRLTELRKSFDRLRVGFLITANGENQSDLMKICAFLEGKAPDGIGLNLIRGNPLEKLLQVDLKAYAEAAARINAYNTGRNRNDSWFQEARNVKTTVSQGIIMDTVKSGNPQLECRAGTHIAVLYPEGEVAACELLETSLGNLREHRYDFRRIWKREERTRLVANIKSHHCFCTHECFITTSLLFSPKQILRILGKACGRRLSRKR